MRLKTKDNSWLFEWHKWFAWHPVYIDDDNGKEFFVWLEYVERKAYPCNEYVFYILRFCV